MKIAYLDCFSGVAGDMILGALIDAGVPVDAMRGEIAKLKIEGVDLKAEKCVRKGIMGTDLQVVTGHDHAHRHLSTIERIIDAADLTARVKERAKSVFRKLGEAEAAIHGIAIEKVHFHEVGAVDAIVDIVGACAGLDLLGVEKLYCSALNLGSGTVKAAHGVMPVPAPATAALVKGLPTYSDGPAVELTTPTGAAIVSTLAERFGPMPAMRIAAVGYGAGDREFPDRANMVRLVVGEASRAEESTEIFAIEANVDDMSPEWAGYVREQLLEQGALDVTLMPVFMKKDRPGYQIQALAKPEDRDRLGDLMLAETTTIGIRYYPAQRRVLERSWKTVATVYGDVRIKVASEGGVIRNFAPEYEDCKRVAHEKKVPLKMVWQQANFEYLRLSEEERH
jgi:uncharacterized protein (TIGR00299 family) protein